MEEVKSKVLVKTEVKEEVYVKAEVKEEMLVSGAAILCSMFCLRYTYYGSMSW